MFYIEQALENELWHLKNVFCTKNDYPEALVEEIIKNEQHRQNQLDITVDQDSTKKESEQEEI